MRKVLMIAPTSFFSDYGGHIRILEETLALQSIQNRITIATYYKGRDLEGIDIRRTAKLPYRTEYEVGSSRHKLVFDIYLMIKSLRIAFKERPDIIHAHMHEGA
ncbi:MAG: glycosyltransferase family 1 protein, partial [Chloroflexota bacterium]